MRSAACRCAMAARSSEDSGVAATFVTRRARRMEATRGRIDDHFTGLLELRELEANFPAAERCALLAQQVADVARHDAVARGRCGHELVECAQDDVCASRVGSHPESRQWQRRLLLPE